MNITKNLKAFFEKLKNNSSYDSCYQEKENKSMASNKQCPGLAGGDMYSGHLAYHCIECPYLNLIK